jgi:hypothetical protein
LERSGTHFRIAARPPKYAIPLWRGQQWFPIIGPRNRSFADPQMKPALPMKGLDLPREIYQSLDWIRDAVCIDNAQEYASRLFRVELPVAVGHANVQNFR